MLSDEKPTRKPHKGGKRRLRGGRPRLLSRHDGLEGARYRRAYAALEADLGPFTPDLVRMEAGRVAVAWLNLVATTEALDAARRLARGGKGRRPGARQIERLAKRQGLADSSYSTALDKLRGLVGPRHRTPDEILSDVHAALERGDDD